MVTENKRKLAVCNWAGHQNFGDELILLGLRQLFSNWDVHVYSNSSNSAYPLIDFDAVNRCDLFVLGGGELINSDNAFIASPYANKIRIPKMVLGCGINVEKAKELKSNVIRELEQFGYIGLRDRASVDILSMFPQLKSRVDLFYDLAYALDLSMYRWGGGGGGYAVVIPTDRFNNKSDKGVEIFDVAKKISGWLGAELAGYKHVLFYPFGVLDNDDFLTCKRLSCVCRGSFTVFQAGFGLESLLWSLCCADKVFTFRLHGLVLAHMLGAKFVFYPYHWKLQRVYDTVKDVSPEMIRLLQRSKLTQILDSTLTHKPMRGK